MNYHIKNKNHLNKPYLFVQILILFFEILSWLLYHNILSIIMDDSSYDAAPQFIAYMIIASFLGILIYFSINNKLIVLIGTICSLLYIISYFTQAFKSIFPHSTREMLDIEKISLLTKAINHILLLILILHILKILFGIYILSTQKNK